MLTRFVKAIDDAVDMILHPTSRILDFVTYLRFSDSIADTDSNTLLVEKIRIKLKNDGISVIL